MGLLLFFRQTTLAPVNAIAPIVTGSTVQGSTLSCTSGVWGGSPVSYAYQWYRDNSGGGVYSAIGAATAFVYSLAGADVGCHVECRVTATNPAGSTTATSNIVGLVTSVSAPTSALWNLAQWA